jgi:N-acetylglucosaminyldiphosphoundecaprenol N-acetyl-beta-D-mannosaminyltransferase
MAQPGSPRYMPSMPSGAANPREWPELVGLPLAPWTAEQVADHVFAALGAGRGGWLVTANVDFLLRARREPDTAALYRRADAILADGQPLVWAARLRGTPVPERVAGADLVRLLTHRAAAEGRRLYLLGGAGEDAARAAERLRESLPALHIAGFSSPAVSLPPKEEEIRAIREALQQARPDLVFVGFGSPKQERVIEALRADLPGAWMMGCGVSLSFLAGTIPRAPRWLQRLGLEWLHRLTQEPARLARRYLWDDLPFTLGLLFQSLREGRRRARRGAG